MNTYAFNPLQNRMDSLMQQRQMIDQQMQSLQQMNVPPININNNIPPVQQNYDGNFKWVNSEQEAMQVANNNLPLILFDNNEPKFYMKNVDGSFKTFQFEEIIPQQNKNQSDIRLDMLEDKMESLLKALGVQNSQDDINTPSDAKDSQNGSKQVKGGSKK